MNSLEKALYPNDFLNPTEEIPNLLSKGSLSIAVDSGWYTLDTSFSSYFQDVFYGRSTSTAPGAADNTFGASTCLPASTEGKCSTQGQKGCSLDGLYKTSCKTNEYSGDCLYESGTEYCFLSLADKSDGSKDYETRIPGARCVLTKKSSETDYVPTCLKVDTSTATTSTSIKFTIENAAVECTTADELKSSASGQINIKCPSNPTIFAYRWGLACTNDCSGNGVCLYSTITSEQGTSPGQGSCFCFYGWTGTDCSTAVSSEPTNPITWSLLNSFVRHGMIISSSILFVLFFIEW